jgi:hypothetical protein
MSRAGEVRLARLEAGRERAGSEKRHHLAGLRAVVELCATVREAVLAAGADPAEIAALRRGEEAAAELAAAARAPGRRPAGMPAPEHDPSAQLAAELARIARQHAGGGMPAAAESSLAEWLAWASLRHPSSQPPPLARRRKGKAERIPSQRPQ